MTEQKVIEHAQTESAAFLVFASKKIECCDFVLTVTDLAPWQNETPTQYCEWANESILMSKKQHYPH